MNLELKIADLKINIDSFYDKHFAEVTAEYISKGESFDFFIKTDITQNTITPPDAQKLTDRTVSNWYIHADGRYEYIYYDKYNDANVIKTVFDMQNKRVYITLLDVNSKFGVDTEVFLFNAVGIAFNFILLFNNGFVVHASSIVYDSTGLAFSAESGTGKSTHTGLWVKNYPGTVILNDDKPVMRFVDGKWNIYGTPWAGTTGINKNLSVPLKALVFLERSENNTIRDCVGAEAIKRFFEAVIHPFSDETTDLLLNSLTLLIKHSRICVLGCNMTDDAPKAVREFLYD